MQQGASSKVGGQDHVTDMIICFSQEDLVWPPWVQYTTHFSHLLTVINSSVNFYIYFLKHYKGHIFKEFLPEGCFEPPREAQTSYSQVKRYFMVICYLILPFRMETQL
jgi:hypothetical protein